MKENFYILGCFRFTLNYFVQFDQESEKPARHTAQPLRGQESVLYLLENIIRRNTIRKDCSKSTAAIFVS